MAQWKGKAAPEQEGAGGGGNKFPPAPRGFYTIQVADFTDGVTHLTRRPKVDLECEIADQGPEFGKKVWLTITQIPKGEKGHGLMLHQLHAFGIEVGENYSFDTDDLQGAQATALIGVEQREKFSEKHGKTFINDVNFVEQVYTEKHPQPDTLPPEPPPRNKGASQATAKAPVGAGATAKPYEAGVDPDIGW